MKTKLISLLERDIIIAPSTLHLSLLKGKNRHAFSNPKIVSKEQLIDVFYYELKPLALAHICQTHNLSVEIVRKYFADLPLLKSVDQPTAKINFLQGIEAELRKQNLLIEKPYLRPLYLHKAIAVIGYHQEDNELKHLLSLLQPTTVDYFKSPALMREQIVTIYDSIEEEVGGFFNTVLNELDNGKEIKDFALLRPSNDHIEVLDRLQHQFKLPLNLRRKRRLSTFPLIQQFFKEVSNDSDIELAYRQLVEKHPTAKDVQRLGDVLTDYPVNKLNDPVGFLNQIAANTDVETDRYLNGLQVVDTLPLDENITTFILGFSEGKYPASGRDVEFLSAEEKMAIGRNSFAAQRDYNADLLIEQLQTTKNLVISFAKTHFDKSFYLSQLVDKLAFVRNIAEPTPYSYALPPLKISVGEQLDAYNLYGIYDDQLSAIIDFDQGTHNSYQNDFKGVDIPASAKPLRLSFSSVDSYYQCPFKYYVKYKLLPGQFTDNFNASIGTLVHKVMELAYSDGFDFDQIYAELSNDKKFTKRELVILANLKGDIKTFVDFNLAHNKRMQKLEVYTERKIEYKLADQLYLQGTVDKILVTGTREQPYLSVIDYKSNAANKFNSKHLEYGLSLQLPIYGLLIKQVAEFETIPLLGMYLQSYFAKSTHYPNDTREDYVRENARLSGLSLASAQALKTLDPEVEDQTYVGGIRFKKNGDFYSTAPVVDGDGLAGMLETARTKVMEAGADIKDGKFDVAPVKVGSGVNGCKFCEYQGICYRKDSDYRVYGKVVNEEESEEEDNGE